MQDIIYKYKGFYITKAVFSHDAGGRFDVSDTSFFISKEVLQRKDLIFMIGHCETSRKRVFYTDTMDIVMENPSLAECKAWIDLQEFRV